MSFEVKSFVASPTYEQLVTFVKQGLFILVMLLVKEGMFEHVVLDKLEDLQGRESAGIILTLSRRI